jgi:phosphomannomutase / phosphoglucomutase
VTNAEQETNAGDTAVNASADIWVHALTAIVVATVGITAAFVVLWWLLIESGGKQTEIKHNEAIQQQLVAAVNGRIKELENQATSIAASPPIVARLLATQDSATSPEQPVDALVSLFPHFRRVEVFARGAAEVDLKSPIPITFAALDLMRKAETQTFAGPEASTSQRDLIYAAAPITIQGKVAGVLFVVVDSAYFGTPFETMNPSIGSVELIQSFMGSTPTTILQWGNGNTGDQKVEGLTVNPNWTLKFLPSINPAKSASATSLLAPLLLCLAVVLGGVFIAFSRLGRGLTADLGALRDFGTRLISEGSATPTRFKFSSIQVLAAALSKAQPTPSVEPTVDGSANPARTSKVMKSRSQSKTGARINELLAENRENVDESDFLEVTPGESHTDSSHGMQLQENPGPADLGLKLDPTIFRAYDIRGITTTNLTADVVYWIGRAFASEALALDQTTVAVGRDGRLSSAQLRDALTNGLNEGGVDVLDIGMVPTPLLYYATHELNTGTGIMITGSHNPPEYNGLKMVLAGVTLAEGRIQRLLERLEKNDLTQGRGETEIISVIDRYLGRVLGDVAIADPLKVVIDCGNGVAGLIAPRLIEEMGCEVVQLYCDVDGNFPNHHPDPAEPHNLEDLITVVQSEGADIGLAFDGDGDRLGVVTNRGEIIWPDKLMMLFSQDIVGRNPGADIIYDVKCSRHLNTLISEYGGRPIMWKTGHSHMKAKIRETGALLAGEFSGHICFGERWYGFDDALYSAARLLEIVSAESRTVDDLFAQFPVTFSTPEIKINTTDRAKFQIMERLRSGANFGDGTITTIDGLRVDYADGWGLIRPSNTSPVLSLRFEADGQSALQRIQMIFQKQLTAIDPTLKIG